MIKNKLNLLAFVLFSVVMILSLSVVIAQPTVNLGTAGNFVVLAKSGISTTGITSIVGDMGVSPIDSTAITGFDLIGVIATDTFLTSSKVTGKIYAADLVSPTPSILITAVSDMETAYIDAAGRSLPDYTELYAGDISGKTLTPGLYKWGTGVLINSGVTLDCAGNTNAVFIFQIAQDLLVGNGAIVTLSGGCQSANIIWQVAGQTILGTTSQFKGIILDQTNIAIKTGATLDGRALAQTAVTLEANAVTKPILIVDNFPTFNSGNPSNKTIAKNIALLHKINATDDKGVSCFKINDTVNFNINCTGYLTNKTVLSPGVYSLNVTINDTINQKTSAVFYINVTNNVCVSNLQNTTWSTWANQTSCRVNGTILQNRSLIRYDLNSCVANTTFWEYKEVACIVTSPTTEAVNVGNIWQKNNYNVTLNATTAQNAAVSYINYTLNNVSGRINGSFGNVLINVSGNNTLIFYAVDNVSSIESTNKVYALLDKELPNITLFTLSSTNVIVGTIITSTCNVTDNLDDSISGIITGIDTSTTGTKTAICTATDFAGNVAIASTIYTVNAQATGGSSGGGSGTHCNTQWNCTEWSVCNTGSQIRDCSYKANYCTPSADKPLELKTCIIISNTSIGNSNTTKPVVINGPFGITGAVIGGGMANNWWWIILLILIVLILLFFLIRFLMEKYRN